MAAIQTDYQLFATLIKLINEGFILLKALGTPGYDGQFLVMQKDQPTKQGVPSVPTVFVEKLFDRRFGFANVIYIPQPDGMLLQAEEQLVNTTIQVSTRSMQFPGVNIPTASDVLSVVAGFVQSRKAVDTLQAGGAGILRVVSNLTNGYQPDDQDRPEASPSFDIVVTYTRTTPIQIVNTVKSIDGSIQHFP